MGKVDWGNITKPSFFLVGAAKSGTTSISSFLTAHAHLFISPIKEPNFFSDDIEVSEFSEAYNKSLPKNIEADILNGKQLNEQIAFLRNEKAYRELFKSNETHLIAGEASTSYLFSKVAAGNIKAFNPNAKIIICLRNPIERAYSHYLMAIQMGKERQDFKSALLTDIQRKEKGWGKSELYIELGAYAKQVEHYYNTFGKDNVCVLLFEDWKNKLKESQEKLCQFLNVPIFTHENLEVFNKSVAPKNPRIHRFFMQSGIKDMVKQFLPKSTFLKLKNSQYKEAISPLKTEDREFLKSLYREDILMLQDIVQRDLNNWIK